ncbi:TonB-dependent receptor [Sphingomonas gilva]|uniref:TonB-dependent receptor n=1 Tax=Sphingomonas gilva TaxID=2305907 RepID=A0A396RQT1_9SPHN|nr:TonB-dependent receptor [Sphingomonas gilva]RHW16643.1 TonB-dependent receptor [Sphingomonas gilva]
MRKAAFLSCGAAGALLVGLATPAWAQVGAEAAALPQEETIADPGGEPNIIVTGSLIRGTPEDAALPVEVISAEDLAKQGSPTALDLIKNLPVSNGVIGDANQFDSRAQGSEGVASVNLRGLGPGRTLVLLNGKRLVPAGTGVPVVDVNLIPQAAIGRVEILKDGAAATYGSDAIAGVVNFITRERQNGFTVSGDYRYIEGSDGDYGGSIAYGHNGDGFRMLASFGYQRRSELRTTDRDFVIQPYEVNPQGGWTGGGNPGNFDFDATVGGLNFVRDLGCEDLGGFRSVTGSTTDRCFNQYGLFGNLVEPEERLQAYLETEIDIGESTTLNLSALYGFSSSRITTSPTYLPTLSPSGYAASPLTTVPASGVLTPAQAAGAGVFGIPTYAPSLRDYCATYGAAAGCLTAGGVPLAPALAFPVLFRPALLGGNPAFRDEDNDRGSAWSPRTSDSIRFTAGLEQRLGDNLTLDAGFTYHFYERYIEGTDTFGDRLQNALAGFGGFSCPYESAASRAGLTQAQLAALAGQNGCLFFNPFSTAVQVNPVTGDTNPNYAGTRNPAAFSLTPGAGLINSKEVFDYFFVDSQTTTETELFVGDLVLSGQTGIELPGGQVGFAIGGQYRKEYFSTAYGNNNNLAVNPCPGSVLDPNAVCPQQTGALGFLGTNNARQLSQDIKAAFVEIQAPITDAINLQLSARYEDYGGLIGSTFDPQGRIRFQLTDWLALRAGAGTTFRGPPIAATNGSIVSLQIIGTSFRAVDVLGNPELTPESSTNYSAGIILNAGPFSGTIDYWRYDIDGPIEAEPVQGIVNALFGASGSDNCGEDGFELLEERFTFSNNVCGIANVQRLETQYVNNNNIRTSGIDAQAQFQFELGEDTEITLGANGTYVFEYKVADVVVEGVVVQPAFDAVGQLNYQTTAYPLPEWKGQVFASGEFGIHSLRLAYNFMADYTDQRGASIFGPNTGSLAGDSVTEGKEIDGFNTLDFTYRIALPTGTSVALSALNILDEDPPFARLDQNYDPFTANPLGFTAKISVSQNF